MDEQTEHTPNPTQLQPQVVENESPSWHKPGQAAQILAITPSYLRKLSERGLVEASGRTKGGHRRYSEADIERVRAVLDGERADVVECRTTNIHERLRQNQEDYAALKAEHERHLREDEQLISDEIRRVRAERKFSNIIGTALGLGTVAAFAGLLWLIGGFNEITFFIFMVGAFLLIFMGGPLLFWGLGMLLVDRLPKSWLVRYGQRIKPELCAVTRRNIDQTSWPVFSELIDQLDDRSYELVELEEQIEEDSKIVTELDGA